MKSKSKFQPLVILVADEGTVKARKAITDTADEELPFYKRLDEAVVSIARAVFAAGADLAMPLDREFAPLVAHVAGEYLAPRFAENIGIQAADVDREGGHQFLQLFSLPTPHERGAPSSSTDADGSSRLPLPPWASVFTKIGIVAESVIPFRSLLANRHPASVMVLGTGRSIETVVREVRKLQLGQKIYYLTTCGPPALDSSLSEGLIAYDSKIASLLSELRERIQPLSEAEGGEKFKERRFHKDSKVHESRFSYFPYALIAQLFAHDVIENEEGPHGDIVE